MIFYLLIFSPFVYIFMRYLLQYYKSYKEFWGHLDKFAGYKAYPIVGNAYLLRMEAEDNVNILKEIHESTGFKTIVFKLGPFPIVFCCELDHIEAVLGSNTEIVKASEYNYLKSWLGDGLLLSTGDKWRRRRKILTPAFHFSILEQFVEVFNVKGDILIKKLSGKENQVVDVYPYITLYALDVISEAVMGVNVNVQENSHSEYVKAVYRTSVLFSYRLHSLWKKIDFLYSFSSDYRELMKNIKILHTFTSNVINERKRILNDKLVEKEKDAHNYDEEVKIGYHNNNGNNNNKETTDDGKCYLNEGGKKKMAFLDLLLQTNTQEGEPLSDEDIREEVDTFMFEGHDTTSAAISFAMYLLANNKESQDKAFEEQRIIMGDDPAAKITFSDLQKMKYLEIVIKETLRLFPPVPFYGRILKEDLKLPDGRVIPAKAEVGIMAMTVGRNPKYFPDPESFIPERFLSENLSTRHPYQFLAFSAGPRNCIGQRFAMLEVKNVLSKILRSYELYSAGPEHELRLAPEITLKDKNGQRMQMKKRLYPIRK